MRIRPSPLQRMGSIVIAGAECRHCIVASNIEAGSPGGCTCISIPSNKSKLFLRVTLASEHGTTQAHVELHLNPWREDEVVAKPYMSLLCQRTMRGLDELVAHEGILEHDGV